MAGFLTSDGDDADGDDADDDDAVLQRSVLERTPLIEREKALDLEAACGDARRPLPAPYH